MSFTDFLMGATLMNAMPHLVMGIWKARLHNQMGFGDLRNFVYGLSCLLISITLFIYKYRTFQFFNNGIFTGAIAVLALYIALATFHHRLFNKD